MSELNLQWSADAFDAINIMALDGEFEIVGTEGEQVELEGEFESRVASHFQPQIQDRWLVLHPWGMGDEQLTLKLPKHKAWVINLSAARGSLEVSDLQARLRANFGKGEVEARDCRGAFNLFCGHGDVEIENFTETEVPTAPPLSQTPPGFTQPPIPPTPPPIPPMPPDAPEFVADFGRGRRARARVAFEPRARIEVETPWDNFSIDAQGWAEWGKQFAEEMRGWARQFAGTFGMPLHQSADKPGIALQLGRGAVEIESLDARTCAIRLGDGDVEISSGRIEQLDLDVAHGSVQVESVLPVTEWSISVKHGDVSVALPSDTQARLDVATRHGDIDSEVPLVRVGRPGPESRHGGRMVGTVGSTDAKLAELHLETVHGDIAIEWQRAPSGFAERSRAERATAEKPAAAPDTSSMQTAPPNAPAPTPAAVQEVKVIETAPEPTEPSSVQIYDSQLAILQALSKGEITVDEAEMLLKSLRG